jgi:hypothetical protein
MALGKKPAQINRTPAPKLDRSHGGTDYGEANAADSVAVLPPSQGGPQTKLGQNILDSVSDDVFQSVLGKGTAGRGDFAPVDGNDQLRPVSAESYPPSHSMKRQQADYGQIGKNALPKTLGASAAPVPDNGSGIKP